MTTGISFQRWRVVTEDNFGLITKFTWKTLKHWTDTLFLYSGEIILLSKQFMRLEFVEGGRVYIWNLTVSLVVIDAGVL